MDELKELLQKRMTDYHLGSEALAATVCYGITSLADGKFTATRYKNGVLTISVSSASLAADIQANIFVLKKRFAERVAPHPITRVIIRQEDKI